MCTVLHAMGFLLSKLKAKEKKIRRKKRRENEFYAFRLDKITLDKVINVHEVFLVLFVYVCVCAESDDEGV